MEKLVIRMAHEKETKGTHVYSEMVEGEKQKSGPGAAIGTLYCRKDEFGLADGDKGAPEFISVTVETWGGKKSAKKS